MTNFEECQAYLSGPSSWSLFMLPRDFLPRLPAAPLPWREGPVSGRAPEPPPLVPLVVDFSPEADVSSSRRRASKASPLRKVVEFLSHRIIVHMSPVRECIRTREAVEVMPWHVVVVEQSIQYQTTKTGHKTRLVIFHTSQDGQGRARSPR